MNQVPTLLTFQTTLRRSSGGLHIAYSSSNCGGSNLCLSTWSSQRGHQRRTLGHFSFHPFPPMKLNKVTFSFLGTCSQWPSLSSPFYHPSHPGPTCPEKEPRRYSSSPYLLVTLTAPLSTICQVLSFHF